MVSFLPAFPKYPIWAPPHSCYMYRPSHPPWLDHCNYTWWSSSLCSFLQPPVTSSLYHLNILLSTLFSNTLILCSSINVIVQVSYPYKMVASLTQMQSLFNFVLKKMLISYCHSYIFQLCHIFNGSVSYLYVTIFPCILVTRQQRILSFLCVCF
jgi:hypothetical protein